jgi:hyperosmotically inducible periplasmic protein
MAKALLVLVLLCAIAVIGFGWRPGTRPALVGVDTVDTPVGTTGRIDVDRARERGADVGEKAAEIAIDIQETVAEASVTSKVKAKMALDDVVRATAINVTTQGTTVTLTGNVRSEDERQRAVRLAQDTDGVSRVIDRLAIRN